MKINIVKKILLIGYMLASVVIIAKNAESTLYDEKNINFLNSIGAPCPNLEMLKPRIPVLNNVTLTQLSQNDQGGNSIVYSGKVDGISSIIKISKNVAQYNENSEAQKSIRVIEMIKRLNNPVFHFALPTQIYNFVSQDGQRVCDVQIAPKAEGQKINKYVYQYVGGRLNNTTIFEKLGKNLAQFQLHNIIYGDDFDYGPIHGDFQIGNIFYNENDESFTLIDLSDFTSKGKLLLDPIYFVYFLPHMWGSLGKSNEQFFRERYNNVGDNFKKRINEIVASFFHGYITNLPKEVSTKIYSYFQQQNNSGLKLFGNNARTIGLYGQELQNTNSYDILEPLIKKAFVLAYEKKYGNNNNRDVQNDIISSPIELNRYALRDAAFEQKNNNKGYFTRNGNNYIIIEENNRFLELYKFLVKTPDNIRRSITISSDGTVSSPYSNETFKIHFEQSGVHKTFQNSRKIN